MPSLCADEVIRELGLSLHPEKEQGDEIIVGKASRQPIAN